jgi:hypothetical protein
MHMLSMHSTMACGSYAVGLSKHVQHIKPSQAVRVTLGPSILLVTELSRSGTNMCTE